MMRVVVVDVKDSSTNVHVPTEEVETMGQALENFIIWPARLAKPILVSIGFHICFIYVRICCNWMDILF